MAQKKKPVPDPRKIKPSVKASPASDAKKATPAKGSSWFTVVRKQMFFILLVTTGLYVNTLDLDYALDDTLMITQNTFTLKGVDGLKEIFTNDAFIGFLGKSNLLPGGRYRPLSHAMFAVEYELFGLNPFVGHFINLLLYCFLALLLFRILRMLLPEVKGQPWNLTLPFVATLLFVAHPLHTEVVANIKGRDELLSMLGTLGCLYLALKYVENRKPLLLAGLFIVFFLAILSKENALAYIAVIPLTLGFFRKGKARDITVSTLPLLGAVLVYFGLRAATVGFAISNVNDNELLNNPFLNAGFAEKYATIFYTWLKYFGLLLFPHPLTHDYYPKQIPIIGFGDIRAIAGLLISVGTLVVAMLLLRKRHIAAYAILFFWLTFAMSSNFILNIGAFMNERFMFAPLLGFTLIAGWLITDKLKSWVKNAGQWKSIALTLFIVLMAGYALKTMTRNRVWKNDFVLFTTDVEVSSNSAKCNTSAGGKLLEWSDSTKNAATRQEYLNRSEKYLKKAAEIYPQNINTWLLLGNLYIKKANYTTARECFDNCLNINPAYPAALNNLLHVAQVTNRDKLYQESILTYKDLRNRQPDSARNDFGIGLAFKNAGVIDSAIFWFRETLKKDSLYGDAWGKLGEIYGQNLNDLPASEAYLLKAVRCNPKDASSLENLGIIHALRKDFKGALDYMTQAYNITPDNFGLNMNIAKTYEDMGQSGKAQMYYENATKIKAKESNGGQ